MAAGGPGGAAGTEPPRRASTAENRTMLRTAEVGAG